MKATWDGQVIAQAERDDVIFIESNWYFPPDKVNQDFLRKSDTPYTCPWKGECQYFDVGQGEQWSKDNAWSYPNPKPTAIEIVKHSSGKDFSNYIAFWRDITVED